MEIFIEPHLSDLSSGSFQALQYPRTHHMHFLTLDVKHEKCLVNAARDKPAQEWCHWEHYIRRQNSGEPPYQPAGSRLMSPPP